MVSLLRTRVLLCGHIWVRVKAPPVTAQLTLVHCLAPSHARTRTATRAASHLADATTAAGSKSTGDCEEDLKALQERFLSVSLEVQDLRRKLLP